MKQRSSFAQILAEVRAEPATVLEVCPGAYNRAGDFFDPAGNLLSRVGALTCAEAADLVRAGAQLAWEGCGWGGCVPDWIDEATRRSLSAGRPPRFAHKRGDAPTWIDVWQGDCGPVVYAHGNVQWGNALA